MDDLLQDEHKNSISLRRMTPVEVYQEASRQLLVEMLASQCLPLRFENNANCFPKSDHKAVKMKIDKSKLVNLLEECRALRADFAHKFIELSDIQSLIAIKQGQIDLAILEISLKIDAFNDAINPLEIPNS